MNKIILSLFLVFALFASAAACKPIQTKEAETQNATPANVWIKPTQTKEAETPTDVDIYRDILPKGARITFKRDVKVSGALNSEFSSPLIADGTEGDYYAHCSLSLLNEDEELMVVRKGSLYTVSSIGKLESKMKIYLSRDDGVGANIYIICDASPTKGSDPVRAAFTPKGARMIHNVLINSAEIDITIKKK